MCECVCVCARRGRHTLTHSLYLFLALWQATGRPLQEQHAALIFWSNTAQAVPQGAQVLLCVCETVWGWGGRGGEGGVGRGAGRQGRGGGEERGLLLAAVLDLLDLFSHQATAPLFPSPRHLALPSASHLAQVALPPPRADACAAAADAGAGERDDGYGDWLRPR
jgi:hypothetical protein